MPLLNTENIDNLFLLEVFLAVLVYVGLWQFKQLRIWGSKVIVCPWYTRRNMPRPKILTAMIPLNTDSWKSGVRLTIYFLVNTLLISRASVSLLLDKCMSSLVNWIIILRVTEENSCLQITWKSIIRGSKLGLTQNITFWDDAKVEIEQNIYRPTITAWQEHHSVVTRKESNSIFLFPQPPVLYEMLLGTSMIQSYLGWVAMDHLPAT